MELLEGVGTGATAKPLELISVTLPTSGYQVRLLAVLRTNTNIFID